MLMIVLVTGVGKLHCRTFGEFRYIVFIYISHIMIINIKRQKTEATAFLALHKIDEKRLLDRDR